MPFSVSKSVSEVIESDYLSFSCLYPQKARELNRFFDGKDAAFSECMKFIYGNMHANDVLTYSPDQIAAYVSSSLKIYDKIEYIRDIPEDIFLSYVLTPRVNNEWLDGCRDVFAQELLPIVSNQSEYSAALLTNAWCFGKVSYMPSDERTLGPLGAINAACGRCGEESVFTVNALRSVGIPSRQCYVPRWSHCDDNHAWVEIWLDGKWHYLGACEPENQLNSGWFTSAASKAMLVHTKEWSHLTKENIISSHRTYREVNTLCTYAPTRILTVQVTDSGAPLENCKVLFQIINYSELYTIYSGLTDGSGYIEFETGRGDILISVAWKNKYFIKKIDVRNECSFKIDTSEFLSKQQLLKHVFEFDIVPPAEQIQVQSNAIIDPQFISLVSDYDSKRKATIESFNALKDDSFFAGYRYLAKGNISEIDKFISMNIYTEAEKKDILDSLRPKDFVDITCDVLCDALGCSLDYKERYKSDLYSKYILAPRIADEMLFPYRTPVKGLIGIEFTSPVEIQTWMHKNLKVVDDEEIRNYLPTILGCVKYGMMPTSAEDFVFVGLCRAYGFPARLNENTRTAEYFSEEHADKWINIHSQFNSVQRLSIVNDTQTALRYMENYSLGLQMEDQFYTIHGEHFNFSDQIETVLPQGLYRLISTTRQIDGTASARISYFELSKSKQEVRVELPQYDILGRLKHNRLDCNISEGEILSLINKQFSVPHIMIFADPGTEPTEHLFQEIIGLKKSFVTISCRVDVILKNIPAQNNPTFRTLVSKLPEIETVVIDEKENLASLHMNMDAGDMRLPFVVIKDSKGFGRYSSSNYNVGEAQTILNILSVIIKEQK